MIFRALAQRAAVGVGLLALLLACVSCAAGTGSRHAGGSRLTGPLASMLAAATDLGPSRRSDIASVVGLSGDTRPTGLERWADTHGLRVGWQRGQRWATLSGPAATMGSALDVAIHEYRSRTGQQFYAAQRQPAVPAAVRGEVSQLGRVLNYSPHTTGAPVAGVAQDGLGPSELVTAYGADTLHAATQDTTGTVVFFEWGPYSQSDLDAFARTSGVPSFSPEFFGGRPTLDNLADETELDVEVVHAIAPHAKLVVVDAGPTFDGSTRASVGLAIGQLFAKVDRQFPGAVWSLSIGWGCESMYTAADMQPVQSALETAESHGTSAFDASGDTAGLECKGRNDYATPPRTSDIGLDAIGAVPAMTSVGGTRLQTDAQGHWAAEQTWNSSTLSQGGSGGVSTLHGRPSWQTATGVSSLRGGGHRLVPDVAADADPDTGVAVVIGGNQVTGGGTSQAAPIWAGFTILMDDYLKQHGGHPIGAFNPVAYRIARGASRPAFHDITLGGDAVDLARPGYDLVTGLGTPVIDNLVLDILDVQRSGS